MKNYKLLFICFIIVLASGCAASGPKFNEYSKSVAPLATDKGRIYFYRDASFFGGGVRPDIYLDKVAVGESLPGGFFFVDRDAGSYSVSTSTEVERTLEFTLSAGETKYIRTYVTMGVMVGHVIPELVSADDAMKAMTDLSFAGYYDPDKPREQQTSSDF
ncbi:DUF2846 domain-containing protein [Kaarinaea lacus]